MSNILFHLAGFVGLVAIAAGCADRPPDTSETSSDRPLVVATSPVLCDLVGQVAGDSIDLDCLIAPGQDPHTYEPTPDDRRSIETAQLIFYGGYDYEPDLSPLVETVSTSTVTVPVYELAVPDPLLGEGHHHHGEEEEHHHHGEEEEEDTHAEQVPDPHVWHDVENAIAIVEVLRENLCTSVHNNNVESCDRNAAALTEELQALDGWIEAQIATIPDDRRLLVTTHEALNYYTSAYGLQLESALDSVNTEAKPAATQIAAVVETVKAANVPTVFVEITNTSELIETIAREANVEISPKKLFVDSLNEAGSEGDSYQEMMEWNTCAIVVGLGGECTPFGDE